MAYKVLDICTDALFENGAYGIDTPVLSAVDGQMALRWLNRRLDAWAALKRYAWTQTFTLFTLTPNHQPHLIGPGLAAPDFDVAQRPVRIEGAALVITGQVDLEVNIRDAAWWQAQTVKSIATTVPTDLYYEPDWDKGALWLWPVPTFAYGLRLQLWGLIGRFVKLSDVFSFPPAYERAIVLTLAEDLCRPFGRPLTQDLKDAAREARAELQTNNISSPRIASADYGTQGRRGRGGSFNYYSGLPGK